MKTLKIAAVSAVVLLAGCQMAARTVKPPPLDAEGEVVVYLEALPSQAERLNFSVEGLAATRLDGQEFPLVLSITEVSGTGDRRQRFLASGRLPPGQYTGLSLKMGKAALAPEDGAAPANLLVPAEPVRVPVQQFSLARGHARLVTLTLDFGRSLDKGFGFSPVFTGAVPPLPLVELLGFVTDTDSDRVVVFDKQARRVVAALAAGRDPKGLAVDRVQGRLYVALSGSDEIAAYDLVTGDEQGRARLRPGDRPQELGLTSDRRTLVVTNPGSNSVAFVSADSLVETGERARTGIQPTALLMDRSGRRAYAFNQGSSNISVLDVGTGKVAATIVTDGSPARGAFSRAGDRLYVVSPTSAYMNVLAVPTYARVNQIYVGFNMVSVAVDPRTDWVYVSSGDTGQLQLYAPMSPLPVGRVDLSASATFLALDNAYDVLLGAMPGKRGVFFMEFTSRKVLSGIETGGRPYGVGVVGERN
jgi:YVTN family beta-propeller protein